VGGGIREKVRKGGKEINTIPVFRRGRNGGKKKFPFSEINAFEGRASGDPAVGRGSV